MNHLHIRIIKRSIIGNAVNFNTGGITMSQARIKIGRYKQPHWVERRWQRVADGYRGYYRTRYGSWTGYIQYEYENTYKYFIYNPPEAIKKHEHWQCFRQQDDRKNYLIHFSEPPQDINFGIKDIEDMLTEAFEI